MLMGVRNIVGTGRRAGSGCAAAIVSAVSPVSMEQMHQWTGQYQKEGEHSEKMGAVLGQKEKRADGEKSDQHPFAPAGIPTGLVLMCMIMCHGNLL